MVNLCSKWRTFLYRNLYSCFVFLDDFKGDIQKVRLLKITEFWLPSPSLIVPLCSFSSTPAPKVRSFWLGLILSPSISVILKFREKNFFFRLRFLLHSIFDELKKIVLKWKIVQNHKTSYLKLRKVYWFYNIIIDLDTRDGIPSVINCERISHFFSFLHYNTTQDTTHAI